MTKKELSAYAGKRFYNLSTRMGGEYRDIHCLTVYEITERGTCKYIGEILGCVANKAQYQTLEEITGGHYHVGRPCAECLNKTQVEDLVK